MDNNLIVQLLKRAAHGLGESHVTSATHSQLITDLFVAADGIEMQTALSGLEADGSTKQQFVQIAGIDNDLFALDAAGQVYRYVNQERQINKSGPAFWFRLTDLRGVKSECPSTPGDPVGGSRSATPGSPSSPS